MQAYIGNPELGHLCTHTYSESWKCAQCGKQLAPEMIERIISVNNHIALLGDNE